MKTRNSHILLLLLVTIFIPISCKKGPIQYTFKGTITESVSNSALSDVKVSVYQKVFNNAVSNTNFDKIADLNTNSSGQYEVIFDREKVVEFKLTANKDGYFEQQEIISSSDVSTENENEFNYTLEPISWVTFDIYNQNPESWDKLTLILQNFRKDCEGCATEEYYYFDGNVDTEVTFKTTGGQYAKFIYIDDFSGQSKWDSVFATPFETVIYDLKY